jgi:hypothetical protein
MNRRELVRGLAAKIVDEVRKNVLPQVHSTGFQVVVEGELLDCWSFFEGAAKSKCARLEIYEVLRKEREPEFSVKAWREIPWGLVGHLRDRLAIRLSLFEFDPERLMGAIVSVLKENRALFLDIVAGIAGREVLLRELHAEFSPGQKVPSTPNPVDVIGKVACPKCGKPLEVYQEVLRVWVDCPGCFKATAAVGEQDGNKSFLDFCKEFKLSAPPEGKVIGMVLCPRCSKPTAVRIAPVFGGEGDFRVWYDCCGSYTAMRLPAHQKDLAFKRFCINRGFPTDKEGACYGTWNASGPDCTSKCAVRERCEKISRKLNPVTHSGSTNLPCAVCHREECKFFSDFKCHLSIGSTPPSFVSKEPEKPKQESETSKDKKLGGSWSILVGWVNCLKCGKAIRVLCREELLSGSAVVSTEACCGVGHEQSFPGIEVTIPKVNEKMAFEAFLREFPMYSQAGTRGKVCGDCACFKNADFCRKRLAEVTKDSAVCPSFLQAKPNQSKCQSCRRWRQLKRNPDGTRNCSLSENSTVDAVTGDTAACPSFLSKKS